MRHPLAIAAAARHRGDARRRQSGFWATGIILLASGTLRAQETPHDIVLKALEVSDRESKAARQYTYVEHNVENKLDSSAAIKSHESKTWDVTQLGGSQFRRLIEHNDKPLTPKEEAEEKARQQRAAENRRKMAGRRAAETPEQKRKREEASEKEKQKSKAEDADIAAAFDLRIAGEETIDGKPVWVIDAAPRPGYKFQFKDNSFLSKFKGRIRVAKDDYQPVEIEAETLDTISFGAILARVQKGARLHVQYTRVNDEVWLPKRVSVTASARMLLVKGFHEELDQTYRDYKKFTVESRIID